MGIVSWSEVQKEHKHVSQTFSSESQIWTNWPGTMLLICIVLFNLLNNHIL